jgi:hypothetical protein
MPQVYFDLPQRHRQENGGIAMVEVGEAIAIKEQVFVLAYKYAPSGRKKPARE